jgi:O-antigen/teichoic acid export membrane protein
MGGFSIALTFLGFGILLSNWGFGNLLTREVSRDTTQVNKYLSNYAIIRIVFAVIIILLIFFIIPLFSYSKTTETVIKIITISLLATTLIRLYYSVFIAFEELKYISIVSLIGSILRIGISLLMMITGRGLIAIAIVYVVTEYVILILSSVLVLSLITEFQINFDFRFALGQIRIALPFFWIGILIMLDARTEILILSWFFSETIVGYYTAVNTILGGLTLLSEGVRNSIFPVVIKLKNSSPEKLQFVVNIISKYILIITIPVSILTYFYGDLLLNILFNNQSPLSIRMLQITVWIFISYSLTVVTSNLLMADNMEKKVAVALLISGIITIILNLILINFVGPEGVAIIRLLSSYLMLFITIYYLYTRTNLRLVTVESSLLILLAGGIMAATIYYTSPLTDLVQIILGLLLYSITLYLSGIIQLKDLVLWKKILENVVS